MCLDMLIDSDIDVGMVFVFGSILAGLVNH